LEVTSPSVKICPKCNKEMSEDVVYCPYDGSLLIHKNTENACGKCKKQYDINYKFCPVHGDALSSFNSEPKIIMDEKVLDSIPRSVCPSCGFNSNAEDLSTCPKCGIIISKYKEKNKTLQKEEEILKSIISEMGKEEWECACGISNIKTSQVCSGCGWTKKQTIDYLIKKVEQNKDTLNDNNISNTKDNSRTTQMKQGNKYCRNCGKTVNDGAVSCTACGVPPRLENKYCYNCGATTNPNQAMCLKCGGSMSLADSKNRISAGLLAIFLGGIGIHKFYLGYKKEGIIMLLVSFIGGLLTMGVATIGIGVIAIIEGVTYLTKSDHDFEKIYIIGRKEWF